MLGLLYLKISAPHIKLCIKQMARRILQWKHPSILYLPQIIHLLGTQEFRNYLPSVSVTAHNNFVGEDAPLIWALFFIVFNG